MIIWNGKDVDTFLDILESVDQNRVIEVAPENGIVRTVATLEDVRNLLPARNEQAEITKEEYEEILRTFMPSCEMREHLCDKRISHNQVTDLIMGAPVSLEKKAEYCLKLMCRDDYFQAMVDEISNNMPDKEFKAPIKKKLLRRHYEKSFTAHYLALRSALDALELKRGELFLLRTVSCEDPLFDENTSRRSVLFLSLEAALRYVRDMIEDECWDKDTERWMVLEKWCSGESGEMELLFRYYLILDEIVFFEKMERDSDERWGWRSGEYDFVTEGKKLDLPIPYRVGDIVQVDCRPFAPLKHVLVLEVDIDLSAVTVLFQREDGKWNTGALKHGQYWEHHHPLMSPLYRLRSSNNAMLFRDESVLWRVQKHISGNAEKGKKLQEVFYNSWCDGMDAEELRLLTGDTHGSDAFLRYHIDRDICVSDLRDVWSWDVVDTTVEVHHEDDSEIIFSLIPPCEEQRIVVVWNKKKGEVTVVENDCSCRDIIRFARSYFKLSIIEQTVTSPILVIHQMGVSGNSFDCAFPVYRDMLDLKVPWSDASLEIIEDRLYVILDRKRYAEIATDAVIEA